MNPTVAARQDDDALILSFPAPVRVLSWAVLNGGFCDADHVVNHRVNGNDQAFCSDPRRWLERAAARLGLRGAVVAMATAVRMNNLIRTTSRLDGIAVACFTTVGCGNALSVGDPASVSIANSAAGALHTINMIVTVQPGLSDRAMVEAIQIATEARVRALYEAAVKSSASELTATGTGTDCIVVVSLGPDRAPYCGKHTRLGELIGSAVYHAVAKGLRAETSTAYVNQGDNVHER
jgi:adenosylcobinamide amidohydrolase